MSARSFRSLYLQVFFCSSEGILGFRREKTWFLWEPNLWMFLMCYSSILVAVSDAIWLELSIFRSSGPVIPSSNLVMPERERNEEKEQEWVVERGKFCSVSADKNADMPKRKKQNKETHCTQSCTSYYWWNFKLFLILSAIINMTSLDQNQNKKTTKQTKCEMRCSLKGYLSLFAKPNNYYCSEESYIGKNIPPTISFCCWCPTVKVKRQLLQYVLCIRITAGKRQYRGQFLIELLVCDNLQIPGKASLDLTLTQWLLFSRIRCHQ